MNNNDNTFTKDVRNNPHTTANTRGGGYYTDAQIDTTQHTVAFASKTNGGIKKLRNSNLELYRIIVMLMIVAHHSVVNSGLFDQISAEKTNELGSYLMTLFGAWGKTGIDCFVMITGYFMCRSNISLKKFLKLYLQVAFYGVLISLVFMFSGRIPFTASGIMQTLHGFFPIYSIGSDFTASFLIFYLCIPFLNILVKNMTKRQHQALLLILVGMLTILRLNNTMIIRFNYVEWFSVLYLISSYIRFYGDDFAKISHRNWGIIAILTFFAASASVVGLSWLGLSGKTNAFIPHFLVSDSNAIFALAVAFTSFMWFKDLKIKQCKIINALGGATFGVLLIHAHSDEMRQWLWKETVDVTGHYVSMGAFQMIGYLVTVVVLIFLVCALIDIARSRWIEPWLNPRVEKMVRSLFLKNKN